MYADYMIGNQIKLTKMYGGMLGISVIPGTAEIILKILECSLRQKLNVVFLGDAFNGREPMLRLQRSITYFLENLACIESISL